MEDSVRYREATSKDVPAMRESRATDPGAGPGDYRMELYLDGLHHPREALAPRTAYIALFDDQVIGYIAGHLTTRLGCEGEVQFLFVALEYRRRGIAAQLLRALAAWFTAHSAKKICVDVNIDSGAAGPFYLSQGAVPLSKHWYIWDDIRVLNR